MSVLSWRFLGPLKVNTKSFPPRLFFFPFHCFRVSQLFVLYLMLSYHVIILLVPAVYGFAPDHATKSSLDYALYFGSIVAIAKDKLGEYERANTKYIRSVISNFVMYLFITGTLQSIITPSKLSFFGPSVSKEELFSLSSLTNVTMYGNSLLVGGK